MDNSKILKIKELRKRTQASYADCKKVLEESNQDLDRAEKLLMIKGLREINVPPVTTNVGMIHSYVHPGNKIGVLVEVTCETDFVAKTEEFQKFVKEISLQVASMKPTFVSRDDIGEDVLCAERKRRTDRLKNIGATSNYINETIDAEMIQWFTEVCLLEQTYIRENSKTVKELLAELVNKTGESCRVVRFSRWEIGVEEEISEEVATQDFKRFSVPALIILAGILSFIIMTIMTIIL